MRDFKSVYLNESDEWPDHLICIHCNKRVERGIFSISSHWCNCVGKEYTVGLMKLAENKKTTGESLTLKDVEKIKNLLEKSESKPVMWELLAWELLTYTDEQFIKTCKREDVRVIGGVEQIKLVEERMKKLGLSLE